MGVCPHTVHRLSVHSNGCLLHVRVLLLLPATPREALKGLQRCLWLTCNWISSALPVSCLSVFHVPIIGGVFK